MCRGGSLHPDCTGGNLAPMKKLWIATAVVALLTLSGAWLLLRDRTPPAPPPNLATAIQPANVAFHASKPLRVTVLRDGATEEWLEHELRQLLGRGQMRIAPLAVEATEVFTLQIELTKADDTHSARIALLSPNGTVEREATLELPTARFDTVAEFAARLPDFLDATHARADWSNFIGTRDPAAYESYLRSAMELFGRDGRGFTTQIAASHEPHTVERLEALTKRHPTFARAWAALALAYLGLGGEDDRALLKLAESSAERARLLDPQLAYAHSALGIVRLRRNEWSLALDHFRSALGLDPNSVVALEGLAYLLVDVGQNRAALPIAERAVALQPHNAGAHESLVFAQAGTIAAALPTPDGDQPLAPARVRALIAMLADDMDTARRWFRSAPELRRSSQAAAWVEPLLRAAQDRRHIAAALQAITTSANDRDIDPATEILGGAALRQADFVFNRMLRLHRERKSVPLRLLWLPQTEFLRQHPRFQSFISDAGLPLFWQDHGAPDLCTTTPATWCTGKSVASERVLELQPEFAGVSRER